MEYKVLVRECFIEWTNIDVFYWMFAFEKSKNKVNILENLSELRELRRSFDLVCERGK